jgi:hypothetical protein
MDRTRVALTELMMRVDQQLAARAGELGQERWERKARGFRAQLQRRLVPIKGKIRERDREELLALENGRKEWAAFALALAEAVEASDMAVVLHDLTFRGQPARKWMRAEFARAGVGV